MAGREIAPRFFWELDMMGTSSGMGNKPMAIPIVWITKGLVFLASGLMLLRHIVFTSWANRYSARLSLFWH